MINQLYNLNMIPDKVPVIVKVSQYDQYSRTIIFDLYDGSIEYEIPSGSTITVRGTKPDKTGFEYPCTFDSNRVQFDIEPQQTILSGNVPCELRITSNDMIVGTCNFIINVEETPLDEGTIISDTELPLIEEASQAAVIAKGAAAQALDSANRAEEVLSSAVKSVNGETPDTNGNVDVVALPDGGTQGQVLTKQSSTDGDASWENPLINYEITGTTPNATPINADLLQGHNAEYFATKQELGDLSSLTTTNKTSLVNAINEVNSKSIELLWTNSSPTDTFGSQSINLNLSKYKMLLIKFRLSTTLDAYATTITNVELDNTAIDYNKQISCDSIVGNYICRRLFSQTTTGVNFTSGVQLTSYGSSSTISDTLLIPVKIYGIY